MNIGNGIPVIGRNRPCSITVNKSDMADSAVVPLLPGGNILILSGLSKRQQIAAMLLQGIAVKDISNEMLLAAVDRAAFITDKILLLGEEEKPTAGKATEAP
jgi:hypothetical protein